MLSPLDLTGQVMEPVYGFRSLFAFKAKFQPSYRPMYMAYLDALPPHRQRGQPCLPAERHPTTEFPPRRQGDRPFLNHSGRTRSARKVRPGGGVRTPT
ncbi:hypothetical protein [Lentzea sp. NPDC051838]|uniref:hypothetical protein n=1 Tax=Lentzea sp. NPDC051838 TaxID=3154849 RepID=UPI0034265E7F